MKKVLFITEKWCDANPECGLTNHTHNLYGSLKNTNLAEINNAFYDEMCLTSGTHFDLHAKSVLNKHNPEIVVVSHMGQSYLNPSIKTYNEIKKRGIKLVFIWPDTREWIPDAILSLKNVADLQISWACENDDDKPIYKNHVWMWTPEDETLYFDDTKTTDVSFVGSLNGYLGTRLRYVQFLKSNDIPLTVSGGQREKKLDCNDYAKLIRQSKINLNFSESAFPGIHQCKGRVFETLCSNSLLLESNNVATRRRFVPNEHYIEFSSEWDLKDKIVYFLNNESQLKEIAKNGNEEYKKKYSAYVYWKTVFERIA